MARDCGSGDYGGDDGGGDPGEGERAGGSIKVKLWNFKITFVVLFLVWIALSFPGAMLNIVIPILFYGLFTIFLAALIRERSTL